ncbi:MAG: hypothetical protein A3C36_06470 [Omnitrophica WOR_2 bacterium RIFCSPHIGHO2_02_FULL_52_10]|nr:MAG: hypothetical protein A3C36_06470 [Omnitrophica WOR_2 bacterium RIFCSPHIGHO2_02_FULL_52_10]
MMIKVTNDIFSTVADRDYLSFFDKDVPKYNRVIEFLDFKKEDISAATEVPLSSVRYDKKIPKELHDRIKEWANLLNLVAEYFKGDAAKTAIWFTAPNPLLGNVSPRDMIRLGRYKKLYQFIFNALAENKR